MLSNLDEDGDTIKYELIIYKNVGGELTEIPISVESKGTKNLLELTTVFFWVVEGGICVVDEIDSGIHDILMNNILQIYLTLLKGNLFLQLMTQLC